MIRAIVYIEKGNIVIVTLFIPTSSEAAIAVSSFANANASSQDISSQNATYSKSSAKPPSNRFGLDHNRVLV
jgi:hypothetical protein